MPRTERMALTALLLLRWSTVCRCRWRLVNRIGHRPTPLLSRCGKARVGALDRGLVRKGGGDCNRTSPVQCLRPRTTRQGRLCDNRTEESSVGKERVGTFGARRRPSHKQKK